MSNEQPIHILIADDHAVVLEGMVSIISSDPACKVVARAVNGRQAIDLFKEHNPDITILDLVMPEKDGIQILTEIRQLDPEMQAAIHSGCKAQTKMVFGTNREYHS